MKKLIIFLIFVSSVAFSDSLEVFNSIQLEPSAIHMVDNILGYICGSGGISRTNDFGEHWYHHYGSVNSAETTQAIYDFQFFPDSTAYAVGWRGTPINDTLWQFNNLVIKSTNQGIDWFEIMAAPIGTFSIREWQRGIQEIRNPKHGSMSYTSGTNLLFSVYSFSSQHIIVSGNMNRIYRTTDGGLTWLESSTGWNSILDLYYHNGIVFGVENNQIGVSINQGVNWGLMTQAPGCFLQAISFSGTRIFTVGTNGYLLSTSYTTNNGSNWVSASLNDSGSFTDILFLDDNNAYATAHKPMLWGVWNYPKGYILKTHDGGKNWTKLFEQEWSEMMGVCRFEQHLFFVGMGRVARLELKTLPVNHNQNELPLKCELGQNYPNPFNPSTTINYSLPVQSLVTIKIFDITGKEVQTIVNSEQLPGSYSVQFDGSGLASGTYFYKIQAGSFIETKKMMLIK